ncbi:MAG: hypothetical protein QM756_26570 [Polyangiaceae bacterium]
MKERTNITTSTAALSTLTHLLQHDKTDEALTWLAKSPHFASADTIRAAAGGDARKINVAGTPVPNGPRVLGRIFTAYSTVRGRQRVLELPDFLTDDGCEHRFDGTRVPQKRLRTEPKLAYCLQHLDNFERFDEAIEFVVARDLLLEVSDVTPEFRAHINSHATPPQRAHFAWLVTQ